MMRSTIVGMCALLVMQGSAQAQTGRSIFVPPSNPIAGGGIAPGAFLPGSNPIQVQSIPVNQPAGIPIFGYTTGQSHPTPFHSAQAGGLPAPGFGGQGLPTPLSSGQSTPVVAAPLPAQGITRPIIAPPPRLPGPTPFPYYLGYSPYNYWSYGPTLWAQDQVYTPDPATLPAQLPPEATMRQTGFGELGRHAQP